MVVLAPLDHSDPAPLRRAAAVVGGRGHVLDGADLEADGTQRTDRGLAAGAGTLHEHVDLAHAVLHRPPAGGLGGHLGGVRRRLARALEADGAGRGPRDHRARRVGDGDDRVVERALDVRVAGGHVLLLLAAHLLGAGRCAALGRHVSVTPGDLCMTGCEVSKGADGSGSLLLLAGDRLTTTLAAAGVGPRALTTHRQAAAVPATLVRPDLDLAADVRGHLATEVTFDLVVAFDPVTELHQLLVAQLVNALVTGDTGVRERLEGASTTHTEDVGESDLDALVARQVDPYEACHVAVFLSSAEVWRRAASPPASVSLLHRQGPGLCSGGDAQVVPGRACALWCESACAARVGRSALPLLVPRVLADHHDPAVPPDHLALVADLLDARIDLHRASFFDRCWWWSYL